MFFIGLAWRSELFFILWIWITMKMLQRMHIQLAILCRLSDIVILVTHVNICLQLHVIFNVKTHSIWVANKKCDQCDKLFLILRNLNWHFYDQFLEASGKNKMLSMQITILILHESYVSVQINISVVYSYKIDMPKV